MEGPGSLKCTSTVLLLAVVHDEHQKVHKSAHLRLGIRLGFPVTCADDTTAEPRLNFTESLQGWLAMESESEVT